MIGDEFVAQSGHILENLTDSYSNKNFEVRALGGSNVTNNLKDAIPRLRNTLVTAVRKHNCIPKFIVVIPEDDIIKAIDKQGYGVGIYFDTVINWLINEFEDIMKTYLKFTPPKVRKGKNNWAFLLVDGSKYT